MAAPALTSPDRAVQAGFTSTARDPASWRCRFSYDPTGRVRNVLLSIGLVFLATLGMQVPDAPAAAEGRLATSVLEAADAVLRAFEARDGGRLASLVHPDKGVRFSPSAYVNLEEDVVLSRDEVEAFWTTSDSYRWGYADGSGEPIEMTPAAYAERYILDRDYSNASTVSVNDDQAAGNTRNNASEAYPGSTRVEYYIEPNTSGPYAGFDWSALRLVFENVAGSWLLVGVIHDEWSI